MTARRRIAPLSEVRAVLDMLKEYGVPVADCAIDIGPDGVKVSPPANSNAREGIGEFINRTALGAKAPEKR